MQIAPNCVRAQAAGAGYSAAAPATSLASQAESGAGPLLGHARGTLTSTSRLAIYRGHLLVSSSLLARQIKPTWQ